jgi:methylthioribose-1-phosphate isomerase
MAARDARRSRPGNGVGRPLRRPSRLLRRASVGAVVTDEVAPLRFEEDALLILDQRALPDEERLIRCTEVEQVAEAIETLAVRGAPAIGVAAAYALRLAAARGEDVAVAAERLARTRPTAVNLRWALDRCLEAHGRDPDSLPAVVDAIAERETAACRLIAEHGAALLGPQQRVITHCNAGALATTGVGTALGVVREGFARGSVAEVWVPETRPLLQGARLTAWELGRAGIPHRVVTDSSAGLLMSRSLVDAAVVGADRIAANGDTANKIGTYPLAALAARHGVPFYVAAPLSTIDLEARSGVDIPIEERDPAEVGAPGGAPAANWAFDVTPGELVTAIVTEAGVLRAPYEASLAAALAGAGA